MSLRRGNNYTQTDMNTAAKAHKGIERKSKTSMQVKFKKWVKGMHSQVGKLYQSLQRFKNTRMLQKWRKICNQPSQWTSNGTSLSKAETDRKGGAKRCDNLTTNKTDTQTVR